MKYPLILGGFQKQFLKILFEKATFFILYFYGKTIYTYSLDSYIKLRDIDYHVLIYRILSYHTYYLIVSVIYFPSYLALYNLKCFRITQDIIHEQVISVGTSKKLRRQGFLRSIE
ncbi:hypothetical protein J3Q64DRAFT_1819948 [Phycomyces blakesleeanus]|uniref:Uncharacterized protein n=1 Tax=Phycomyces blakesleeanus TaxID=4837 RepID=A0ABR3B4H5_PHYBL